MKKTAAVRGMCMLATLTLLSGCARRMAETQQLEPTRTAAPRAAATATSDSKTGLLPMRTPESAANGDPAAKPVADSGLTRENVADFKERFARSERPLGDLYAVADDRIAVYAQRAFETFDVKTLRSLKVTPVDMDDAAGLLWYALSSDGRRGVIMQRSGRVDVYDLVIGARSGGFDVGGIDSGVVADLALDATGAVAVVIIDERLQRYNVSTGEKIGESQTLPALLQLVYFARDASFVALQDRSGAIEVRDTQSGAATKLARRIGDLRRVAFSPDGTRLATADNTSVQIWDARTGEEIWGIADLSSPVSVAFPPQGDVVLLYGLAGSAVFYDIKKREAADELTLVGGGRFMSAAFSTDGSSVFALGGSTLEKFDVKTASSIAMTRRFAVTRALWTKSGRMLGWSDRIQNGEVLVLDAVDGRTLHTLQHDAPVRRVMIGRSGRFVASDTEDESVHVWNVDEGSSVTNIDSESRKRVLLCFNPAEDAVVYYEDGEIVVRSFDAAKDAASFRPPSEELVDIADCDNALGRVAFQDGKSVEVMTLDGRTASTIDLGVEVTHSIGLMISADGRWVGGLLEDALVVWDASTGAQKLRRSLETSEARSQFFFDPHGSRVLLRDGLRHYVVDVESGEERLLDLPDAHLLSYVDFPPNRDVLVSVSRVVDEQQPLRNGDLNIVGGAITIWDARSGNSLRTIDLEQPMSWASLSPDGSRLAVFGYDGSLSVWAVK